MRTLPQGAGGRARCRPADRARADRAARRGGGGSRAAALSVAPPGCTGAILAGGRARRYGGRPKGLLEVGGVRMVDRVAAALATVTDRCIVVVADADGRESPLPQAPLIADVRRDQGALGGVHAAIVHAGGPVIVVAWDMPGVTGPLLAALRAAGDAGGVDAVVPWSDGPLGFEPTCAWYGPACAAAIERRLDAGDRRAGAWLADVRTRVLSEAAVRACGDPRLLFANVNTPDDLNVVHALRVALASDAADAAR